MDSPTFLDLITKDQKIEKLSNPNQIIDRIIDQVTPIVFTDTNLILKTSLTLNEKEDKIELKASLTNQIDNEIKFPSRFASVFYRL